jgi:hypothetical protein
MCKDKGNHINNDYWKKDDEHKGINHNTYYDLSIEE